ncbi:MAG: MotE family protein [Pseudomonadota bacterium]
MALPRIRLLPSLMIVGAFALGIQVVGLVEGFDATGGPARAQEGADAKTGAAAPEEGEALHDGAMPDMPLAPDASAPAQDPGAFDPAYMSPSEIALLRDLAQRRTMLDEREQQIALRGRLLEATEKRIDGKIGELKALEERIKGLINQHDEAQTKQIDNLVRVYEKMKPKDAAQIFERLDLDIQIAVAQRMKEAKMAPIMAAMAPESAKTLSTALASRIELPGLNSES